MMSNRTSSPARHRWLVLLVTAASIGLAGCTASTAVACDQLPTGIADSVVLFLVDGDSPALDRELDRAVENPSALFGSAPLQLGGSTGIVVLATYDQTGSVVERGAFNLAGVANDSTRRRVNARHQADCLAEAAAVLPPASGGNLFRALPTATGIAARYAPQGRTAVVATGLGRAGGDGLNAATADFSTPATRTQVLDALANAGILHPLDDQLQALVLLAPTDGIDNSITAGGINRFAADLCGRLDPSRCVTTEVLP